MDITLQEKYSLKFSQMKKTELIDLLVSLLTENVAAHEFIDNNLQNQETKRSNIMEVAESLDHSKRNGHKKNSVFDMSRLGVL